MPKSKLRKMQYLSDEELLLKINGDLVQNHLLRVSSIVPLPAEEILVIRALAWYALEMHPRTYLEFGVRYGYASAVVSAACSSLEIYGIDSWQTTNNAPIPPPSHATGIWRNVGYHGYARLVTGSVDTGFQRLHDSFIGNCILDLVLLRTNVFVDNFSNHLKSVTNCLAPGGLIVITSQSPDEFSVFWQQAHHLLPQYRFIHLSPNSGLLTSEHFLNSNEIIF